MVAKNAGDRDREAGAARLAAAVAPLLPKLAIVISPATRIPGLEVRRDGTLVGEGQSGMLLPADVGYHTVDATAPGYEPWSTTVRIDAAGSAATVEVPPLKKLAAEPAPLKPGFAWSTQRSIGVVLGAVALVGFGVAAGFTVNAATKNAASLPHCPTSPNQCDATGVDLRNQAFDAAHVGTGTLIVGAAAATAGLIVFLTASNGTPKKPKRRPRASSCTLWRGQGSQHSRSRGFCDMRTHSLVALSLGAFSTGAVVLGCDVVLGLQRAELWDPDGGGGAQTSSTSVSSSTVASSSTASSSVASSSSGGGCADSTDCPLGQACNTTSHACSKSCDGVSTVCNGGCCSNATCAPGTNLNACGAGGVTCAASCLLGACDSVANWPGGGCECAQDSHCAGVPFAPKCVGPNGAMLCGCLSNADCGSGTCNLIGIEGINAGYCQ